MNADRVNEYLQRLQQQLVAALQEVDDARFVQDAWTRPQGGGGTSCVLENGQVFERAAVNFSDVRGDALPASASALRPQIAGRGYRAMGVSLVLHGPAAMVRRRVHGVVFAWF